MLSKHASFSAPSAKLSVLEAKSCTRSYGWVKDFKFIVLKNYKFVTHFILVKALQSFVIVSQ